VPIRVNISVSVGAKDRGAADQEADVNGRMNSARREQAGIIGLLTVTSIALVGVIAGLNWGPGLGNDFDSPGSAVLSEIDGILPSGLASDLVGSTFISTETHARSTEPTVNAEGLITGEPPSSLGAVAALIPSPSLGSAAAGNGGQSGTPGVSSGNPTTMPPATSSPTPATPPTTPTSPVPSPSVPSGGGAGGDDDPTNDPTITDPLPAPEPTTTQPPIGTDEPTVTLPPVPTDVPSIEVSPSLGPLP
jgi:hypothetical protein